MHSNVSGHILTIALPSWGTLYTLNIFLLVPRLMFRLGHNKPLCALLARSLRIRRFHATMFTTIGFHEKVVKEVDRQFTSKEGELRELIR